MAANLLEAAGLFKGMMDDFSDPVASQKRIKEVEHKGDTLTHDVVRKLNKSFITPLDREDIYALSGALDDILDLIDAYAQRFVMYNVEQPTPTAKELGFLIYTGCHSISGAVGLLGGRLEDIKRFCVEVNSLENEADNACRETISQLFDEKYYLRQNLRQHKEKGVSFG
jgi:predicted phosphate transport protein (TIGR00153 family)